MSVLLEHVIKLNDISLRIYSRNNCFTMNCGLTTTNVSNILGYYLDTL